MKSPGWIILEDTVTTLTRILPDPAGGMTLQRLSDDGSNAQRRFVLTVNAMQALRAWIREEEPARPVAVAAMTLDEMATILSASGYLVREGRLSEEEWRNIGYTEGYLRGFAAPSPSEQNGAIGSLQSLAPLPVPAIGEALNHVLSGIQVGEEVEHTLQSPAWEEDAHGFTLPLNPTVLQHCLAADEARQGVAVPAEVTELLERARIPMHGLWTDHAIEVARLWPERWPDVRESV
jgi:hypothetical protein